MNRTTRAIVGIFFVLVIAVSGISICQNLGKQVRLDMTERKLYTLSDGTKAILADLKQPITLKLFYAKTAAKKGTDEIRFYNNYYTYVKALLEEYEKQAKGNVILEVIDPRPDSDEEMAAIRFGLRRFNVTEDESFFFGLVLQTQFGVTKTIQFFLPDRQQFVEYDISYLIDTAINRQKKRLGVLSSVPVMGDSEYMLRMKQLQNQRGHRKWGIIAHLEQQFEVSSIPADTDAIDNVDLLLVIHPKQLPEKTLFAIDQFVLKGGRAIVCVDPYCISDQPDRQQQFSGIPYDASSNMPELLNAWGLEMPDDTFAGDRYLAVKRAMAPNRPPETDISLLAISSSYDCFNTENAMTAQLKSHVTVFFAGSLKVKQSDDEHAAALEHIPLLSTTGKGNTWTANSDELTKMDFAMFLRRFHDGKEPVTLGYLVTGKFKTAFPEGIQVPAGAALEEGVNTAEESSEPKMKTVSGLMEAAEPGAVVVLADVDMLSDMLAYDPQLYDSYGILRPQGDNSTLILNALESLSGSDQLISIRSRGNYERPFTVVNDIETKAEEKTLKETRDIEAQVKEFELQLNEKLRAIEGENKGQIINQTLVDEKRNIESQLLDAEQRLRNIRKQKRELVEELKGRMIFYCTMPGPICVLMIAVGLGIYRSVKRRRYISHASDS